MPRWFNIAGPCFADEHYLIPPERRSVEAAALIAQGRWFSLVAGRQTGKTTTLQSLARTITAGGASVALWVDLQVARDQADVALAMPVLLDQLADVLARAGLGAVVPDAGRVAAWLATPATALVHYLGAVCAASERPIVLLFDEADVIVGAAMVSFLTQLRALYLARRERAAPRSVVLAGVRAVRDYVTATDDRRQLGWLGTASPFNVTVENVAAVLFVKSRRTISVRSCSSAVLSLHLASARAESQPRPLRAIALSIVSSFLMQAVSATFFALPAASRRS